MNTVEILKAARELIADESRWAQREYEMSKDGNHCFCALGALAYISEMDPDDILPGEHLLKQQVPSELGNPFRNVAIFNDNHTHAEVLALFDRAIAAAESGASS